MHTATAMAGYWNQPELTDAAFVVENAAGGLTTQWYRTGDVVERRDDGLNSLPGVAASAAEVTERGALAVIVETATITDVTALRVELAERLPPGAQPDHIELTTALPRTGSDKVDHAAAAATIRSLDPISIAKEVNA